ncbi:hypothetical protein OWR29_22915 [Actinoplanes sp. Pm04-4]|uniref:Uncharacterized protein n=1 Tax=Paractinoplanes pyxinae TaxID=2997416 RepID=A0ABT4B4P8_9ACTN|nr:hypothetical protein [Actinoplanes pyxinae]MCY1140860.1 hypothetical protein [Actinoplanes pyxinae]
MEWDAEVEVVADLEPGQIGGILADAEDVVAQYEPAGRVLRLRHRLRASHYGAALVEAGSWLTGEALPAVRREARAGPVLRLTVAARVEGGQLTTRRDGPDSTARISYGVRITPPSRW